MNNNKLNMLIVDAIQSREKVGPLLNYIEDDLRRIARRVAPQIMDDAIQAANIKVWQMLPNIRMGENDSPSGVIIVTATFAMRDEVRKYLRRTKNEVQLPEEVTSRQEQESGDTIFSGLLKEYCDYISISGTMSGAHKFIAKVHGISVAKMVTEFNREIKRVFGDKINNKAKKNIVEGLLDGF